MKNSKERITLGLLCNSTGECMEKPCVVGKAVKPHCFCNWNVSRFVHYYSNSTAWMKEGVSVHANTTAPFVRHNTHFLGQCRLTGSVVYCNPGTA